MKERPPLFLADCNLPHGSEQFDYVRELHQFLWRFVRVAYPSASGNLSDWVDEAINKLEASNVNP